MDKRALTERDICSKFILPAILGNGTKWDSASQVREEYYFTKGHRDPLAGTPRYRSDKQAVIDNPELARTMALDRRR